MSEYHYIVLDRDIADSGEIKIISQELDVDTDIVSYEIALGLYEVNTLADEDAAWEYYNEL